MESDFHVASQLDAAGDRPNLGEADTFEIFDKFVIHGLCRAFEAGERADEILNRIHSRRHSFWYREHEHGYGAIQKAIEMRELMAAVELNVDSIDAGIERYRSNWWKIDRASLPST